MTTIARLHEDAVDKDQVPSDDDDDDADVDDVDDDDDVTPASTGRVPM
jgi:hypothetical protein